MNRLLPFPLYVTTFADVVWITTPDSLPSPSDRKTLEPGYQLPLQAPTILQPARSPTLLEEHLLTLRIAAYGLCPKNPPFRSSTWRSQARESGLDNQRTHSLGELKGQFCLLR
ncbi:hypothetical protein GOODEAATRI_007997 [Goodea atripinnis]|uniref:Uncharacterized protein n=1 Tax=Goodea atripinnis TaxID=208336 RepID=A0ABV0MZM4_9TELE